MKTLIALSLFMIAIVPWPASAHGNKSHAMGTVAAVAATSLEVQVQDGDALSILLDSATEYRDSEGMMTDARPQVGSRVVVDLEGSGQQLTATQIRLAPAAEKGPASHPHGAKGAMEHHDGMEH